MGNEAKGGTSVQKRKIDVRTYTMIGALVLIWVLFTILTQGKFIGVRNISNLARQMSTVGILGAGMVLVIVTGNIDLSVGSLMGLLGGIAAALMVWQGWGTIETILVVMALGVFASAIQGAIIAYTSVPAFIVTLGGLLVFRGILLGIGKGITIAPLNEDYQMLGQEYLLPILGWVLAGLAIVVVIISFISNRRSRIRYNFEVQSISSMVLKIIGFSALIIVFVLVMNLYKGIPIPVLIMAVVVIIYTFVAQKTTFGRSIYAIGGNLEAAKFSGINVKQKILTVFMMNGVVCAIAGVVYSARINAGIPAAGQSMELDAIAAAIIGGTSMTGGSGKVAGAILGALFMATLDNGMSLLNLEAFWQNIVKGVILVVAVWFDVYTKEKGK